MSYNRVGHTKKCSGNTGEWSGSPARNDTGRMCDECNRFIPCETAEQINARAEAWMQKRAHAGNC